VLLYDCAGVMPNYLASLKPSFSSSPSSHNDLLVVPLQSPLLDLRLRFSSLILPPEDIAPNIYDKVQLIVDTAQKYGRLSAIVSDHQLDTITATVLEACLSINSVFGVSQAVESTNGFQMPPEVYTRDLDQLRSHDFSLSRLVHARQSLLIDSRMSHARIDAWDQSDPDLDLLRSLVDGIHIPFDATFVPDRRTPPSSAINLAASLAIDFGWWKLYEQGLCLLIPTQPLIDLLPEDEALAKAPSGWAPKFMSKGGRITSGYHYDNKRGGQINTPYVRAAIEALYGPIHPPDIDTLMKMAIIEGERVGWGNLILWKMDIKGAFNLVFFRYDQAGFMSHDLACGLTVVNMCGNFGWCGLPFVFNVITRAILRQVRLRCSGGVDMFVDDLMGCCHLDDLHSNLAIAKEIIESLLGPGSVADKKTLFGRRLDFVGWLVDLDSELISVSRHNYVKALYALLEVTEGGSVTIEEMEALASRATRYSLICRYMRPFSYILYRSYAGRTNHFATIKITGDLWETIRLWQMFVVLMDLDPALYTRRIDSFAPLPRPKAFLNMDACLTGLGILVWVRPDDSSWATHFKDGTHPPSSHLAAILGHNTPFQLHKEAKYQNAMEFIAIVMSMAVLVSLGHRDLSFILQSDSMSALAWSFTERYRSANCLSATLAYLQLAMLAKLDIDETFHIEGKHQFSSDPLSRDVPVLRVCRENHYSRTCIRDLSNNPVLLRLLALMDPTEDFIMCRDLATRWAEFESIIKILMSPSGGWR
jgi:hypothetical protein